MKIASTLAFAALLATSAATAQPSAPGELPVVRTTPLPEGPVPAAPDFPAWTSFVNGMRDLWPRMYDKVPPNLRDDPQVRQEVARLILEALAQQTLEAIGADGDHPVFLPHIGQILNIAQPNADTIYRSARITPGGTYRLRGTIGSLPIFKMAQFGPTPDQTGGGINALGYSDFAKLHLDASGRFDVILSPTRPAGSDGDWWQLDPRAGFLLVRQVGSDWAHEKDPTLSIERLDTPVQRPRPDAAELERRLHDLPRRTLNIAAFLVDHADGLRRAGYVNRLKVFDVTNGGALVGQFYYEGAYDLKPDEALIIESKVPNKCTYSSLILTNEIYETTDWYNNLSSLNNSQVHVDKDGMLRVIVSARDPGVPNWLDTAGYPTGAVQGRWTECDSQPIPSVRKVNVASVRDYLPADTPRITAAERDRQIRDRRSALQQRPLW